jgi:hypothetical protein
VDSSKQLELQVLDEMRDDEAADRLVSVVRSIVENLGQKTVAARIGWKESRLAHALSERERHVPARLLAVLARMDQADRIPRFFADLADADLVKRDLRTPEEKLAAFREECVRRFGTAAVEAEKAAGL